MPGHLKMTIQHKITKGPFTLSVRVKTGMTPAILLSWKTMGVAPEWGYNPFWSNSIVINQSSIASVIAAIMTFSINVLQDCQFKKYPSIKRKTFVRRNEVFKLETRLK